MSVEASVWAWKIPLAPSQKLVLLALADHSDNKGVCWPSQVGIAEKTCLSLSTVKRVIVSFEQMQLIRIERRHGSKREAKRGGSQPNRYVLALHRETFESVTTTPPLTDRETFESVTTTPPKTLKVSNETFESVIDDRLKVSPRPPNHHLTVTKNTTTTPLPPHGGTARVREEGGPGKEDGGASPPTPPRRRLGANAPKPQPPDPQGEGPSSPDGLPDIIPEEERHAVLRQLDGMDDEQREAVLDVLSHRLSQAAAGKSAPVENPAGFTAVLVRAAVKGELDIPPPVKKERQDNRIRREVEHLREAWESGCTLAIDGKPARPDPWPYIRIGKRTSPVGSLIASGAKFEICGGHTKQPPSRASP